jgi:hypothetical protein
MVNQSINQSTSQYYLTCKLNSKNSPYKASIRKETQTQKAQIHKKQKTKYNTTGKIYKSTGAKPLHSEETQIRLFKKGPVQRRICFKEVTAS